MPICVTEPALTRHQIWALILEFYIVLNWYRHISVLHKLLSIQEESAVNKFGAALNYHDGQLNIFMSIILVHVSNSENSLSPPPFWDRVSHPVRLYTYSSWVLGLQVFTTLLENGVALVVKMGKRLCCFTFFFFFVSKRWAITVLLFSLNCANLGLKVVSWDWSVF